MNSLSLFLERLFSPVDKQLDKVTSYKLVLYFLYVLLGWSIIGSLVGKVGYAWYDILISMIIVVGVGRGANLLLSKYLNVPINAESDLITALILILILTPASGVSDYVVLGVAAAVAMVSKYVLVISRWHIFNPAAFGAFISGIVFHKYASWWVGTAFITPVVFIGGMLVLRKTKRFIMAAVFEITALLVIALETYLNFSAGYAWHSVWIAIVSAPLLFFSYIMLTEPFTSPRYLKNCLPYALVVGFFYGYTKLGISPEESLLIGNVLTYAIEPKRRLPLKFARKLQEAAGLESFVFSGKEGFSYQAGQYMEWTIKEHQTDFRGNRRYLTISSSPTEPELMFTLRIPEKPSSFKQNLEQFKKGDLILADGLAGEFTLPVSEKQKLAFLAGGVGITPFRSMIKYAMDFGHDRDIHLIYNASNQDEFAFQDLFAEASKIGLTTTYSTEVLTATKIRSAIPDFRERTFYVSGPYGFVHSMEQALQKLELPAAQIKTDYFPGYGG